MKGQGALAGTRGPVQQDVREVVASGDLFQHGDRFLVNKAAGLGEVERAVLLHPQALVVLEHNSIYIITLFN